MRLFVSYRHKDSEGYVGLLQLALDSLPPASAVELFVDSHKISSGDDFVRAMLAAVKSCDAVLALIGPAWRGGPAASRQARIFDADDPVRLELRTAISSGVPLFVALLNSASLPGKADVPSDLAPLTRASKFALPDADFDRDAVNMVARIRSTVRPPDRAPVAQARLIVTCPPGVYWSSIEIRVDGKSAGRFMPKPDRPAEFVVEPGRHSVQAQVDMWKSSPVIVQAEPGRTVHLKYTPSLIVWRHKLELLD
jgi:hypothetical protein